MSKKLWFKRKTYGYGWTPNTWQGWLFTFLAVLVFVPPVVIFGPERPGAVVVFGLLWAAMVIAVCYRKGPAPRWQWGREEERD